MPGVVSRIVEVCVVRFARDSPEYLVLKRAPDEPLYPGLWQWVTGTVLDGEKATEAALRELREETGFTPASLWVAPITNAFYDQASDVIHLCPFFAVQVRSGDEPKLSREHAAYEWLPFDRAWERLVWPGQRAGLEVVHRYFVRGEVAGGLNIIKP